jgi:hypothetical protein
MYNSLTLSSRIFMALENGFTRLISLLSPTFASFDFARFHLNTTPKQQILPLRHPILAVFLS